MKSQLEKEETLRALREALLTYESSAELSAVKPPLIQQEKSYEPVQDDKSANSSENNSPYISLNEEKTFDDAMHRIGRIVAHREQSSKQIKTKLLLDGYGGEVIDTAIEHSKEIGLIDDIRFAEIYIRSEISKLQGIQGIERELRPLELDQDIIQGLLQDYYPENEDEVSRALAFLNKKPPQGKPTKDKAFRKLQYHGYDGSTSSTAARIWYESLR